MRNVAAVLGVFAAVGALTFSEEARAQLQPPPPMQAPPPGTTWGAQPQTYPRQPQQPYGQPGYPQGQQQYSATQQQLDAADNAKSFRGLEVGYLKAEVGGEAFGGSGNTQGGPSFGVGGGFRFLTWTLGARARLVPISGSTLWHVDGEAGFHLPLGAWDPYVSVNGGYVTFAGVNGGEVGGALGDDYYFTALLSLGLEVSADALFLNGGGNSFTCWSVNGSAHLGLHFDL